MIEVDFHKSVVTVLIDMTEFKTNKKFDYVFITSGLVSLFTNEEELKTILTKTHNLLSEDGVFVFAVDTIKSKLEDDIDYKEFVSVKTHEGYKLILKSKNRFDIETSIQYSPSIYKLYDGNRLLQF